MFTTNDQSNGYWHSHSFVSCPSTDYLGFGHSARHRGAEKAAPFPVSLYSSLSILKMVLSSSAWQPVITFLSTSPQLLQGGGSQTSFLSPSTLPPTGLFLKPDPIVSILHLNPFELFTSTVLSLVLQIFTCWPYVCQALPHARYARYSFLPPCMCSRCSLHLKHPFPRPLADEPLFFEGSANLTSFMKTASSVTHHPWHKAPV